MKVMSEQRRRATAMSLATMLYPGMNQPTAVASVAYRGVYLEGLRKPPRTRPGWGGALAHLLHGLAAWLAAGRERRAANRALSEMSDRDLADIGLTRSLIHGAFDPVCARGDDVPPVIAGQQECRVLVALGLDPCASRPLTRPMIGR